MTTETLRKCENAACTRTARMDVLTASGVEAALCHDHAMWVLSHGGNAR